MCNCPRNVSGHGRPAARPLERALRASCYLIGKSACRQTTGDGRSCLDGWSQRSWQTSPTPVLKHQKQHFQGLDLSGQEAKLHKVPERLKMGASTSRWSGILPCSLFASMRCSCTAARAISTAETSQSEPLDAQVIRGNQRPDGLMDQRTTLMAPAPPTASVQPVTTSRWRQSSAWSPRLSTRTSRGKQAIEGLKQAHAQPIFRSGSFGSRPCSQIADGAATPKAPP